MTGDPTPPVTPLARHLAERIARDGPITVADYIDVCLQHPEHGYYRRQAAIGAAADFVTAPEISQVFGELIGLWCAVVWQQMGSPASLRLIEMGPGRGTLMRDALRAARLVPAFRAALHIELVETNETLQQLQRDLGKTIVMVTHDPSAAKYAARELHLDKGRFIEAKAEPAQ